MKEEVFQMRHYTEDELQSDIEALEFEIITEKGADRLAQKAHFMDFFEHQIEAWKSLKATEQQRYLRQCSNNGIKFETFTDFYNRIARDFKTKKYTNFNLLMAHDLLKRYNPKIVIDPCIGWGHRMLLAGTRQMTYYGSDIRKETVENNEKLAEKAKIDGHTYLYQSDGAEFINLLPDLDFSQSLLFTCPPYYDSEIYSEEGVENLTYDEFLQWWKSIAQNAINKGIPTFAFQITPKYGDDMVKVVESTGYKYKKSIRNTRKHQYSTHINTQGIESERLYGKVYVFEK